MALYQNKSLQKGRGLSSTDVIPVLHSPLEDLPDPLPSPFTAPSLLPLPSYVLIWATGPRGPLHTSPSPIPPEPSSASTRSRTNYQPGSNNPLGKVLPLRQVPSGEGFIQVYASHLPLLICITGKLTVKRLREDPEGFLNLIRGSFQIHDPTWLTSRASSMYS